MNFKRNLQSLQDLPGCSVSVCDEAHKVLQGWFPTELKTRVTVSINVPLDLQCNPNRL